MRIVVLYEGRHWSNLFPLTFLKPSCELRLGAWTLSQGWERALSPDGLVYGVCDRALADHFESYEPDNRLTPSTAYLPYDELLSTDDLRRVEGLGGFDFMSTAGVEIIGVHGGLVPTREAVRRVESLGEGEGLEVDGEVVAFRGLSVSSLRLRSWEGDPVLGGPVLLRRPWDIFGYAGLAIGEDFERLPSVSSSRALDATVVVLGDRSRVYVGEKAVVRCCTLNVEDGPIMIMPGAQVMEGSHVRGPVVIGSGSQVKMGSRVYGGTVLGNECRLGGEVQNVVFQSFSSKAHDGYLGNSAIGSWCNLGADTNASNLKNTYGQVRAWSFAEGRYVETDLLFCGLMMGDHSKTGINTMFNTGSVVGAFCNVYGSGFPRTRIGSFRVGGLEGERIQSVDSVLATARVVMGRRSRSLSAADEALIHRFHERAVGKNE